jgi:hypothetical protein
MLPSVKIQKGDGFTGASRPSPDGVLAIVAPSEKGTANLAAVYGRQDVALAAVGNGPLIEDFSYIAAVSGNQQVVVPPTTSTAAAYGSVDTSKMVGSSVPTAGATAPLDDYEVIVTFTAAGTIGVTGITYTYSLDGGTTVSGTQALGVNTSITLNLSASAGGTSSGVSFNLGVGSIVLNDTFSCNVTHARMNASDLTAALEALRVSRLNFEGILIDAEAGTGTIGAVDTWLTAREAEGRYYFALLNTRHKLLPPPTGESEAVFAAAMTALVANSSSIRLAVGTDAADLTSQVTGYTLPRPTALFVAARAMSTEVGVDPARVLDGPLTGAQISDGVSGGPKWHDEYIYPGLDDQRLMTLRSFPGNDGTFLTNAPLLSPPASDWVYLQHARIANKAARIAYPLLQAQLSTGLTKSPPDPNTGATYIAEHDALRIEGIVNKQIKSQLRGQVSAIAFVVSRTDDLSVVPVTVTAEIQIEGLAYVKTIKVNEHFVNSISTNV